jgi:ribonuclease HII
MNNDQLVKTLKSKVIIGVDEVGRGSWAGPLVVGAVMLDIGAPIARLQDSKQLTKSAREVLAKQIEACAKTYALGWVWPSEIDELGLTAATALAIERAIEEVPIHDYIVIDGSVNFLPENHKVVTLVKADNQIPAVSAASIIAKVARDNYMAEQALLYPDYGFELHVGYGTARHKKALISHGITALHRHSFQPIRQLLTEQ